MTRTQMAFRLSFSLVFALSGGASTIQLTGDNSKPGFVTLVVDGVTYEALDFTPQRYADSGDTWSADVYNLNDAETMGYFSAQDPYINYSNVETRLEETVFLFDSLKDQNNPPTIGDIQAATYSIFGGSGVIDGTDLSNPNVTSWVTMAQTAVTNGALGDTSDYRFVESPFKTGDRTVAADGLYQGFVIETGWDPTVPEPSTLVLAGSALTLLGVALRRRRRTTRVANE